MISFFNPTRHFRAFKEITVIIIKNHQLTFEMVRRDLSDRYAGQVFGILWSIGHPMILMAIYLFIFTVVMKQKVGGTYELPRDFTTYFLSGVIPWIMFQESMMRGTTAIISQRSLVKQVVFPIEILPVTATIAALVTQILSTGILVVYVAIKYGTLPLMYLLIPVMFFIQILAMVGISFYFSSIGVFFRDLKDFVTVFCTAGFFILPLFYLPDQVPAVFKPIFLLNPFHYMILCWRDVLYFGRFENPLAWFIVIIGSLIVFTTGFALFRRLKIMFGNVL